MSQPVRATLKCLLARALGRARAPRLVRARSRHRSTVDPGNPHPQPACPRDLVTGARQHMLSEQRRIGVLASVAPAIA